MFYYFKSMKNEKIFRDFLNDLFIQIEWNDYVVDKIKVKYKKDYEYLTKESNFWNVPRKNIKFNKNLLEDIVIFCTKNNEAIHGQIIKCSKQEELKINDINKNIQILEQQLYCLQRDKMILENQLINKYTGRKIELMK